MFESYLNKLVSVSFFFPFFLSSVVHVSFFLFSLFFFLSVLFHDWQRAFLVNIISHVYATSPLLRPHSPPAFSFTLLCCSDCPHGLRSCSTKHLGEIYKCWLVETEQHRSLTHVYRFLIISHVLKENLYPRSACFPSFGSNPHFVCLIWIHLHVGSQYAVTLNRKLYYHP